MKRITGGTVRRNDQPEQLIATVKEIKFPNVNSNANVPNEAQGTMYLENTPPVIGHYDQYNILYYQDGNHNNDSTLRVDSNVGPTKYKITKIA